MYPLGESNPSSISYSEFDLRTNEVRTVKSIADEFGHGVAISVNKELVAKIYFNGRIESLRSEPYTVSQNSMEVVEEVKEIRNTRDHFVQSMLAGILSLIQKNRPGQVRCPITRLSQMEKVIIRLLLNNNRWNLSLNAGSILLKAESLL